MLLISVIAFFFVIGVLAVLAWSSRMRTSVILGALAILFLPFGLLVGIGYLVPKAVAVVLTMLPLKDAIS